MLCKLFYVLFFLWIYQTKCSLTPEERQEFLHIHNYLRRSVVPSASNMQELKYNESLEKVVYEYLQLCKFEHRNLDNYGENGRLASDSNITNTVMSWFQERVYFNMSESGSKRCSQNNSQIEYLNEVQCGHYQMLVKGTLKFLGCGYKFCKIAKGSGGQSYADSYISFCFYDSGLKDQPYEIGESCADCEIDYQFCNNELCVPKERYDGLQRTCKVKCQNCGNYFDPQNSCMCDCPDGTKGNSCKGIPDRKNKNCLFCRAIGESCNEGFENTTDSKCNCICKEQYQGDYCNIKKDHFLSSHQTIIDGLPWRYSMMIPVNILEFKNSFQNFQSVISRDVMDICKIEKSINLNCLDIVNSTLLPKDVLLIPGSLSMLGNGSLSFRLFINYSVPRGKLAKEKLVDQSLINRIWNDPSNDLKVLIDGLKSINLLKAGSTTKRTEISLTTSGLVEVLTTTKRTEISLTTSGLVEILTTTKRTEISLNTSGLVEVLTTTKRTETSLLTTSGLLEVLTTPNKGKHLFFKHFNFLIFSLCCLLKEK